MKIRRILLPATSVVFIGALAGVQAGAQTPDGRPDLNGIWQALNTAAWDIQDHVGQLGIPPGQGVVEGNDIPYQDWAAAQKPENFRNRMTDDPVEANCYLSRRTTGNLNAVSVRDRSDARDHRAALRIYARATDDFDGWESTP